MKYTKLQRRAAYEYALLKCAAATITNDPNFICWYLNEYFTKKEKIPTGIENFDELMPYEPEYVDSSVWFNEHLAYPSNSYQIEAWQRMMVLTAAIYDTY